MAFREYIWIHSNISGDFTEFVQVSASRRKVSGIKSRAFGRSVNAFKRGVSLLSQVSHPSTTTTEKTHGPISPPETDRLRLRFSISVGLPKSFAFPVLVIFVTGSLSGVIPPLQRARFMLRRVNEGGCRSGKGWKGEGIDGNKVSKKLPRFVSDVLCYPIGYNICLDPPEMSPCAR